jgi:hypothetical protein
MKHEARNRKSNCVPMVSFILILLHVKPHT